MKKTCIIFVLILVCLTRTALAQDISLFQQFNGRYDYTAIGNTLNTEENGSSSNCEILTASSADLSLSNDQNIVAAYLYWAGSGSGDFNIKLNGLPISAERTFSDALDTNRVFFSAFANVTELITNQGSTTYTLSEFDLTTTITPYCYTGTNFGGWALTVIYENENLPLNQLNIYDGLQSVPTLLNITLNNLNVLDNQGAKIGFVAWEGDSALSVNEQLTINGNVISNLPLNPANNAFNGTNSFTGATDLYNMDIDVYNIQDMITIGDTSASIALTSGQDFVMINSVITVLNSQLPDATIAITNSVLNCSEQNVTLYYTINNFNSTASLPSNTPIAFYVNNVLVAQSQTETAIGIGSSENGVITITIPEDSESNFSIIAVVDDDGSMNGNITETNENNNSNFVNFELLAISDITILPNLSVCNTGFNRATLNLFDALENLNYNENQLTFYQSLADLETDSNTILNPSNYNFNQSSTEIFVKYISLPCYEIFQFNVTLTNCPPFIPEGFSPNNDTINDWFNISGLYNIFINHNLTIYNRYGDIIFEGNNNTPWTGKINRGINNIGNTVPTGTYYYILNLNDANYKTLAGWVYVNY